METRAPFSLFGERNNGSNILGANRPFQNVIKNNTGDITMTAVPILNNGSRGTPFILTFTLNNSGIPLRISAEQVSMEVYPNPSTGIAVISGEIAGQTTGTLTIMNPMGQVVYRQEIGESFTEKVDLSNAAKGLYLVKVEGKGFSQVGRLILE